MPNAPDPAGLVGLTKHLGHVGVFIAVAEQIAERRAPSIDEAVRGITSRETFRKACRRLERALGEEKDSLVISPDGVKTGDPSTWAYLTPLGIQILNVFTGAVRTVKPATNTAPPPPLRLVVEGNAMLDEFAPRRLSGVVEPGDLETLPAETFSGRLARRGSRPHAAIGWAGAPNRFGPSVRIEQLEPAVPLCVVSRSPSAIAGITAGTRDGSADLEMLPEASSFAYPSLLPRLAGVGPRGVNRVQVESFADVLYAVLSGRVNVGVVPALPEAIDGLRWAGLLWQARLRSRPDFPSDVSLALVTREGNPHPELTRVKAALESAFVAARKTGSQLDVPALHRSVPTDPAFYTRQLFGYFVEVRAAEQPTWRAETLRFKRARVVKGEGNAREPDLQLTGGTIRSGSATFSMTGRVWGGNTLSITASGRMKAESSGEQTVTFLAAFPCCESHNGGSVLRGFWLGQTRLGHPVTGGMIISDKQLGADDLKEVSTRQQLQTILTADAFDLTPPLDE